MACVRVRFQRHDVLPYAFCFNFLEATGSISFPLLSLFFLPFFYPFRPSPPHVLSSPDPRSSFRHCSLPRGSSAKCTTVVFSTVDAARYISSSSSSYPSLPSLTHGFSPSSHARSVVPTAPCLAPFPPSRLSLPHGTLSHAATPPTE